MGLVGKESSGPGTDIENEDQARNAVLAAVRDVEAARQACNVVYPGDDLMTAREQRKAYREFMIKYGVALDRVVILKRCRLLSDVAYNELRQRVFNTLVPTVVGESMGGVDLAGQGRKR